MEKLDLDSIKRGVFGLWKYQAWRIWTLKISNVEKDLEIFYMEMWNIEKFFDPKIAQALQISVLFPINSHSKIRVGECFIIKNVIKNLGSVFLKWMIELLKHYITVVIIIFSFSFFDKKKDMGLAPKVWAGW